MFNEGDLIRKITEDGDGDIIRVLETPDYDSESVYCATGNDDGDTYIDPGDYELVTSAQDVSAHLAEAMEPNVPKRTMEEVHEDISKMFVQVAQYMGSKLDGDSILIKIEAEYGSGDNFNVSFGANVTDTGVMSCTK